MALFDFFKNKKDKTEEKKPQSQEQIDIERFEKELLAMVPRYISTPNAEVKINARHHETHEIIPFAVGFPESFNQWRNVKSKADRRGILYALLDSQFGNQLELWQAIERFNDDRYAQRALQIGMEHKKEKDEQNPNYWSALAKSNFILTNYEASESNCQKAFEIDNQNIRTKRIYADVLHTTNRENEAHGIYREILNSKLPKDTKMSLPLQELLGFDGDIINSPIYALGWLRSDKQVSEADWEWANDEFYYNPHFRSQYAYELIKKGENLKGFAKLYSLSKEMPWFKEAVFNTVNLIDQLNLTDEEMQADKQKFQKIIKENNWTDENMLRII
jgi:septum formation topological specificity factor MinE